MTKRDLLLLFLAIGIIIGYAYALDTPQALQIPLRASPYNFTSTQFNLIYFSTFLLIGFLQIPLGIIIDRYPIKRTLIIMLLMLLLSQTVISMMFEFRPQNYFIVILIMRSIFGLAGQGLYTVQCLIMSIFAQQQYQFLAGLALALPFGFDAINSVTTTHVYDATSNLPLTWYIGCFICVLSLICGFWMNKSIIGEQNQSRNQKLQQKQSQQKQKQYLQNQQIKLQQKEQQIKQQQKTTQKGHCLKELKAMDYKFWVMAAFIFFSQASLGPFNDNLNQLIVQRFNVGYTNAGKLLLIPFTMLVVFTLFCGYYLRKKPSFRRRSMLIGTGNYLFAHLLLFFLPNTKSPQIYHYFVIIYFLLSMAFNFAVYYASITTSISFLVDSSILGTAWGVAGSMIGFSQCLVPLLFITIIGGQTQLSEAYKNLSGMGVILAIIPLLFAMWVNYYDFYYDILDVRYAESDDYSNRSSQEKDKDIINNDTNIGKQSSLEQSLITNQNIEEYDNNYKSAPEIKIY